MTPGSRNRQSRAGRSRVVPAPRRWLPLGAILALLAPAHPTRGDAAVSQLLATPRCLFVVTEQPQGVHALCEDVGRWRPLRGLPDAHPTRLAVALSGHALLATSRGLFRAPAVSGPWGDAGALAAGQLAPLDARGEAWLLGLFGHGARLARWSEAAGGSAAETTAIPDGPVSALTAIDGRRVAVAIWGEGVFTIDGEGQVASLGSVGGRSRVAALVATDAGTLLAGTLGSGVQRLESGSWHRNSEPALRDADVVALAASGVRVAAATWGEGVWLSGDEGRSWQRAGPAAATPKLTAVAFGASGALWAGTATGLLRWDAAAGSWKPVAFERPDETRRVAAIRGQGLYALVNRRGLLRSRDAGLHWESLPGARRATTFAADGRGRLLAGSGDGVLLSEDGGQSWRPFSSGLPGGALETLRASPGGDVYAIPAAGPEDQAERMRLYRLGEDDRWEQIAVSSDDPLVQDYAGVWDLLFLPSGEGVAYGLQQVLCEGRDRRTWRISHFGQLASPAEPPGFDLAGGLWSERQMSTFVQRSPGGEWEDGELPAELFRSLTPLGAGRAVALRRGGGLSWLTRDGGGAWRVERTDLAQRPIADLAWDGQRLFVATAEGLLVSADRGASWQERPYGLD